jgi:hypothetical protein
MAILLSIKAAKPFVERVIRAEGDISDNITVGIKAYTTQEVEEIREDFLKNVNTTKLQRVQKKLDALHVDTSIDEDVYESKVEELQNILSEGYKALDSYQRNFCKKHIAYIKNASISLQEDTTVSNLIVKDTREAQPIESLWATPEEALDALLEVYLSSPSYKDSLYRQVPSIVFNTDTKGEQLKN